MPISCFNRGECKTSWQHLLQSLLPFFNSPGWPVNKWYQDSSAQVDKDEQDIQGQINCEHETSTVWKPRLASKENLLYRHLEVKVSRDPMSRRTEKEDHKLDVHSILCQVTLPSIETLIIFSCPCWADHIFLISSTSHVKWMLSCKLSTWEDVITLTGEDWGSSQIIFEGKMYHPPESWQCQVHDCSKWQGIWNDFQILSRQVSSIRKSNLNSRRTRGFHKPPTYLTDRHHLPCPMCGSNCLSCSSIVNHFRTLDIEVKASHPPSQGTAWNVSLTVTFALRDDEWSDPTLSNMGKQKYHLKMLFETAVNLLYRLAI